MVPEAGFEGCPDADSDARPVSGAPGGLLSVACDLLARLPADELPRMVAELEARVAVQIEGRPERTDTTDETLCRRS